MEKKHLKNYLDLRIKQLSEHCMKDIPESTPSDKINQGVEKTKARMEELRKLRDLLCHDEIKDESKRVWRWLYDRGEMDYEDEKDCPLSVQEFNQLLAEEGLEGYLKEIEDKQKNEG